MGNLNERPPHSPSMVLHGKAKALFLLKVLQNEQISDCYPKIKNVSNIFCKCSNGIEERFYDLIQVTEGEVYIFIFRDYTSLF